jgi:hypothetical protein
MDRRCSRAVCSCGSCGGVVDVDRDRCCRA